VWGSSGTSPKPSSPTNRHHMKRRRTLFKLSATTFSDSTEVFATIGLRRKILCNINQSNALLQRKNYVCLYQFIVIEKQNNALSTF
jgi:hypothetical protein